MPKFAANLTMLFNEMPFLDRFAAAKAAGFSGVEYLFPYDFDKAVQLVSEVRSNNLFIQYDIYHMQIMEGDLARTVQEYLDHIAHIQLADNPGRHEPGTGEINYPFLFRHLDAIGYRGWIGCEYKPRTTTVEGLGWHAALTADT